MSCVLLIEDHKDFRDALRYFLHLHKIDANVVEASSGEAGILLARLKKPDLVILDFFQSGINGIETATEIKQANPKCPIIMLTMFNS